MPAIDSARQSRAARAAKLCGVFCLALLRIGLSLALRMLPRTAEAWHRADERLALACFRKRRKHGTKRQQAPGAAGGINFARHVRQ